MWFEVADLIDHSLSSRMLKTTIVNAGGFWQNQERAIELYGHVSTWDTSGVTSMQGRLPIPHLFFRKGCESSNVQGLWMGKAGFDEDLSKWDVSQVTDMSNLFCNAESYNHSLETWDVRMQRDSCTAVPHVKFSLQVSSAVHMTCMFSGAKQFNQPLLAWRTGKVERMQGMFFNAASFNQPLDSWDTRRVLDMYHLRSVAFRRDMYHRHSCLNYPPVMTILAVSFIHHHVKQAVIEQAYHQRNAGLACLSMPSRSTSRFKRGGSIRS